MDIRSRSISEGDSPTFYSLRSWGLFLGDTLRIQFPRVHANTGERFNCEAGQYVFICIPSISLFEWHPFTISSSPSETLVTIHIKPLGDWTKELLAKIPLNSVIKAQFSVLADGPYGSVSIDIGDHKTYSHVALFSGGIGITPMQAIANQLFFDYQHCGRELKKVVFNWSVRERAMVEAMMNADFVKERKLLQGHTPAYLPALLVRMEECQPDPENPIDRRLQHCVRYDTRPDIEEILKTFGQKAEKDGNNRVAVLVCRPSALIRDVINISMMLQRSLKIKYDVHIECFEF